jgi:hypothetical protein
MSRTNSDQSVRTFKANKLIEKSMESKRKELTSLKFNHIKDQTQLQSPQAKIYTSSLLIYLLANSDVFLLYFGSSSQRRNHHMEDY